MGPRLRACVQIILRSRALLGAEDELAAEVRKQERQRQMQAQAAKKRLEIRRKEVLRSDPHFARTSNFSKHYVCVFIYVCIYLEK